MLPDELVLMIIKKAADLDDTGHAIIVDVIPYISARFNRLAKDKSLWHGRVNIKIGPAHYSVGEKERKLRMVIRNHLGAWVKSLSLKTDKQEHKPFFRSEENQPAPRPTLTAEHMNAMAVKCPNLKKLHISGWFEIVSMPALENPWNLEHLSLDALEINPGAFNDMAIQVSLPNLRIFEMFECHTCTPKCKDIQREMIELPDMSNCEKLEKVILKLSDVLPAGPQYREIPEETPFPKNLKTLRVLTYYYQYFPANLYRSTLENCDVYVSRPRERCLSCGYLYDSSEE